jgi:hypothetical protein
MTATVYVEIDLSRRSATIAIPGTAELLTWSGVTRTAVEGAASPLRDAGWELVPRTRWSLLSPPDGYKRPVRRIPN